MFGNCSIAKKRYRLRMRRIAVCYLVVLFSCSWLARHERPEDTWITYFFSVLPAIPVIVMIFSLGRYLQEENDEFQRQQIIFSILIATGALLGMLVVSDFLRSFTPTPAFPPFVLFGTFFTAMGITQGAQAIKNRPGPEEPDEK